MKIFIDAVGIRGGGGATVLWNILKNISFDNYDIDWTIFLYPLNKRSFDLPIKHPKINFHEVNFKYFHTLEHLLWHQVTLPQICKKQKADVLLCMANIGAVRPLIPQVIYFQQSLYFVDDKNLFKINKDKILFNFKRLLSINSMKSSSMVITQTEAIRKKVINKIKIKKDKVIAIHTGVPEPLSGSGHPVPGSNIIDDLKILNNLQKPMLLYISHPAKHKNFEVIFKGMKQLKKIGINGTLLLTLNMPQNNKDLYDYFVQMYWNMVYRLKIEDRVKFIGTISPHILKKFINNIDIFVFSSLHESFPQPLTEGMSCGAVMLLADRPYAREIAGDAALYFNPFSSLNFAQRVEKIYKEEEIRKQLSKLAKQRSKLFNYKKCSQQLIDVLIKVGNNKIY